MVIYGAGLTERHWKTLFIAIKKCTAPAQFKAKIFNRDELKPQSIINTCERLAKNPPRVVLFAVDAFETFRDCLFFLSQMQIRIPPETTSYGFMITDPHQDLRPFVAYRPRVVLSNGVSLIVMDPNLLVNDVPNTFPRIKLDEDVTQFVWRAPDQSLERTAPAKLPLMQPIALKSLVEVMTPEGKANPDEWLRTIVYRKNRDIDINLICGILKEKQGCHLFPGVPVQRVSRLILGDLHIDYVIQWYHLNNRSNPFQRLIETIKTEPLPGAKLAAKDLKELGNAQPRLLNFIGGHPILHQLLERLLAPHKSFIPHFIQDMPEGHHLLESDKTWIQLTASPTVRLQGDLINWRNDIDQILKPLHGFIQLDELEIPEALEHLPFSRIEMEHRCKGLIHQEKQLTQQLQLVQSRRKLTEQELHVVTEALQNAQILMDGLANSRHADEILEKNLKLDAPQAMILCEDKEKAGELNQALQSIPKKLWVDSSDYNSAEMLRQFSSDTLKEYVQTGVLVSTHVAHQELEHTCGEIILGHSSLADQLKHNEQLLEDLCEQQTQLLLEKKALALHWLSTSLHSLISRHLPKLLQLPQFFETP